MHIGILDDNQAALDYVSTALQMEGHTVSTHTTAFSLLAALFEGQEQAPLPYDLVILDLLLPEDLAGLEVFRFIRTAFSAEQLPVLLMTAASDEYIRYVQDNVADTPLLRKPFRIHELLQMIDRCMGEVLT